MTENLITVKVKLFAIYQEVYQQEEITLSLSSETQIKQVLDLINQEKPELNKWLNLTRLAVNFDFVSEDYLLKNGDEIALIPPVSGG